MAAAMAALERGFEHFGIDFYIVGAVARDLWLSQVHDEPLRRMTKDLDLAVFIPDAAGYEALRAWLVAHEGFSIARHSAFCLQYWPAGTTSQESVTVDLMPFGAIADELGDVYFTGRGRERISTVGFKEVLAEAATMTTPTGGQWRVVTLPGWVVLKLVAWQDRPEMRGKDATDVWGLLDGYFDLIDNLIYLEHADLFDENELAAVTDFKLLTGARVLGRQMRTLVAGQPVRQRLLGLLAAQLALGESGPLARAMSRRAEGGRPPPTLAACLAALRALRQGLEEDPSFSGAAMK